MTEVSKLELDRVKFLYETGIDLNTSTMYINQEIDDELLARVTVAFIALKDRPITILLNSAGGDVWVGMAIIDQMRAHKHPVTVKINGVAASMACVIAQAAAKRVASPNAILMHHVGSIEVPEGHYKNVKKLIAFNDKYSERVNQLMLDRVNEKRAADKEDPRTMAWWKEFDSFDRWYTAEEALQIGFIDEIENA